MFEPVRTHGNLSSEVVNQIIQLIKNGELNQGDKLPAERDLAVMLGVSRTVIRDALKTLVGLGMVNIRHGMGAFINIASDQVDISRLESFLHIDNGTVDELFQVRQILETQAVIWCIENASVKDIEQLEEIVRKAKIKDSDNLSLLTLDAQFHLKICEASGNRVLMRLMINLLDLLGESRTRTLMVSGRQKQSVSEHSYILDAIKNKDVTEATKRMSVHLEDVRCEIREIDYSVDWEIENTEANVEPKSENQV